MSNPEVTVSGPNDAVTEMQTELARLRAENAALVEAAKKGRNLTFKVGNKGGMSVYGLGRFPTTLYKSQWRRLIKPEVITALEAFLVKNDKFLSDEKDTPVAKKPSETVKA